jgi:predicted lipoprotein with Yx(FWY)xxD motif
MPRRASQRRSTLIVAAAPAILGLTLVLAPVPATAASSSGHTLSIIEHVAKIGTVLATSSGRTLYHFTADPSGKSTCQGVCAEMWPALLLPKGDTHVKGPHGLKGLTTIHEAHGKLQVAFHGEALYRYVGDTKKGQANGQGVEGKWFAVLESGATSSSSASTASTTTSSTATPTTTTAPSTPSSTKTQSTTPTTTATHTTPTTTKAPPPTTAPPTSTIPPPTTTQPPPTTTTTTTGYGY